MSEDKPDPDPKALWLPRIREVFSGYPVAWLDPTTHVMYFDGIERTLEVFNADVCDQRVLIRAFRPLREHVEAALKGPVVIIFHTRKETARLYPALHGGTA